MPSTDSAKSRPIASKEYVIRINNERGVIDVHRNDDLELILADLLTTPQVGRDPDATAIPLPEVLCEFSLASSLTTALNLDPS